MIIFYQLILSLYTSDDFFFTGYESLKLIISKKLLDIFYLTIFTDRYLTEIINHLTHK